ncbi:Ion channel [Ancylostoma caninum]|uniref:Ion channel n=1 Tax=Ancylostoma caninum TaxID=29170 RepID=A0A368FVZ1_ANCCA|nr:Ion channel [Ancylostoma caninum]
MSAPIASTCSRLLASLQNQVKALLPLLGLIVYTLLGALLFSELEGPNEQYELELLKKQRDELFENTVYRLNNVRAMQPIAALNHTRRNLLRFQEKLGVDPVNLEETRWNFWGAVFYCMTVYTTIGEIRKHCSCNCSRPCPNYSLRLYWHSSRSPHSVRPWSNVCAIMQTYLEIHGEIHEGCKQGFGKEGTSLYFTLISFTTIGFGDVLPSEYDYIVIVGFLLLIGLSLVSTVLTLIQQQIEALASGMQRNIDREYQNALAEAADEGEISKNDLKKMSQGNIDCVEAGADKSAQDKEVDPRSMDAVLARMPWKERLLYRAMPTASKKRLAEQTEQKMQRRTRGVQTDKSLLEALIHEEILKMELNNELPPRSERMKESPPKTDLRHRAGSGPVYATGFRIANVVPVSADEPAPEPTIKTTTIRLMRYLAWIAADF